MIVRADSPLQDAKALHNAARANPGKLIYGSASIGSIAHLGMEELGAQMDVHLQHVPYKGSSQVLSDLMGGAIDMMLTTAIPAMGLVKNRMKPNNHTHCGASVLRDKLVPGAGVLMPGVANALAARMVEAAGFPALMVSGAARSS